MKIELSDFAKEVLTVAFGFIAATIFGFAIGYSFSLDVNVKKQKEFSHGEHVYQCKRLRDVD